MFDLFWAPALNANRAAKLVEYQMDAPEEFDRAMAEGSIWLTPHYGNFEWTAYCMGLRGVKFHVIAQDFQNPSLTPVITKLRESSGHTVIPQHGAMLKFLRQLKRGGHAAFLPDLTVPPSKAATVIECFGLKASVTLLHAVLVQRTKRPVVPGLAIPLERGRWRLRALAAGGLDFQAMNMQEIAQACWDLFEAEICENPAPWLWMYKHWRYRPRGEEGEKYPAYANHSKAFDRLVGG